MTNLLNDVVYVSLADARDTSEVFTATVPSDTRLTQLITEAQYIVDWYIGSYGTALVEWQHFIFPTVNDNIPLDIKLATVQISEYVYAKGQLLNEEKIVSESNQSRSVSFSDKEWYQSYIKTIGIPKKVLKLLDKYRNDFIWQVI